MTAQEILDAYLGGQAAVRAYLRGVEAGGETDLDAQRAMLTAIRSLTAAGVDAHMAGLEPELYAQACLLLCRLWTDAEDGASAAILGQYRALLWQLRYDPRNGAEETEG